MRNNHHIPVACSAPPPKLLSTHLHFQSPPSYSQVTMYTSTILLLLIVLISHSTPTLVLSQSTLCRTSCGNIPIHYPFGIDDGCGSPYYRRLLICSTTTNTLQLRTPSGNYPIHSISYTDPHILITDPLMWKCQDRENFRRPTRPFSLDTSTHLTLSTQNDYLFFNCSPSKVIIAPRPMFCERFPERCDSTCDSASYLCRHLPECELALGRNGVSCCSYYPKATQSLRMMLKYCSSYTSVYWRNVGPATSYNQVPEYGIRVDFDIPVIGDCLTCQDRAKGGGTCGFDTSNNDFLCLCEERNVTTFCKDHSQDAKPGGNTGAIAGTVTAVSVAGAVGIGAGVWYLKKVRAKAPVACGVESNENRLF